MYVSLLSLFLWPVKDFIMGSRNVLRNAGMQIPSH